VRGLAPGQLRRWARGWPPAGATVALAAARRSRAAVVLAAGPLPSRLGARCGRRCALPREWPPAP